MNDEKTLTFDIKIKGENNKVIGAIEKAIVVHYDSNIHRQFLPIGFKQNHDVYSLLVCNYPDDNVFQMSIEGSSYCKFTNDELFNNIGVFSDESLEIIKAIPTIVLRPSKEPTDEFAIFGFVTNIERKANELVINFFLLTKVPLKYIYNNMDLLKIKNAPLNHQLEEECYSFYDGNIVQILKSFGLSVPVF